MKHCDGQKNNYLLELVGCRVQCKPSCRSLLKVNGRLIEVVPTLSNCGFVCDVSLYLETIHPVQLRG